MNPLFKLFVRIDVKQIKVSSKVKMEKVVVLFLNF